MKKNCNLRYQFYFFTRFGEKQFQNMLRELHSVNNGLLVYKKGLVGLLEVLLLKYSLNVWKKFVKF